MEMADNQERGDGRDETGKRRLEEDRLKVDINGL